MRPIKSTARAPAIASGAACRFSNLRQLELYDLRSEAAAIACLVPLLLAADFWNGFPLIYYDTGAYLLEGLGGHFLVERSPVYSLFLRFAGAGISLWFVALVQSIMVGFAIVECARAIVPRLSLAGFLLIGAVLAVATGLPWYVGQIEPDCFTALVVLALYMLAFHAEAAGRTRAVVLVTIGGFATAAHPSHLVLAAFLMIGLLAVKVLRSIARREPGWPAPRLLQPALVCLLGIVLVVASNLYLAQAVFVSRAGASFVFARMLQDGLVMRLLDETCPGSGYRLCAYRNSLPPTADGWLWTPHSPFFQLGHFEGTSAESARIVRDSLLRYPLLQLRAAALGSAVQFVHFRTGQQIEPQEWVLAPVFAHYVPAQMASYLAARQQRGALDFHSLSRVHVAAGFACLAGLLLLLAWSGRTARAGTGAFPGFVLAALIANAVICGVLSGPHDRYQSRVIWLAPFAVALAVASRLRALQGKGESGT